MNLPRNIRVNARDVARQFRSRRRSIPLAAWPWPRVAAASLIAGTAILFAALVLDVAAIATAYRLPTPVVRIGQLFSEVGRSVWFLVASGVFSLIFLLGNWHRVSTCLRLAWWEIGAFAGYAFVAFASAGILVNILKVIFGRARPRLILETGPFSFDFIAFGYSAASFPSGHSTDMGVFMVVASILAPRFRVAFVTLAMVFASSRIVVLAHYPSDVAAGLMFGATVAYLLARVYARAGYGVTVGRDGRLVARLPTLRRLLRRPASIRQLTMAVPLALIGGEPKLAATLPPPERPPDPP